MKKIVFLAGILFCIYSCKITEKIPMVEKEYLSRTYNLPDSLTYQVIEIVNPIIYEMLDSILELSKACIFNIHEQPCRYNFYSFLKEDTTFFLFYAEQYDDNFYSDNYAIYPDNHDKYCFVYKEVCFTGYNLFPPDSVSNYFSDYFRLTDKKKKLNIYFPNTEIYYCKPENPVFLFIDYTYIRYVIYNNAIVEIETRPCQNIDVIYHTVKRKETLKELAEKYNTTEKHIRTLNPQLLLEDKLPIGKSIRVQ
jgi:hypothetical protein